MTEPLDIESLVVGKLRVLPPEQQREVLAFVERLQGMRGGSPQRRPLAGLWSDLGIELSEQEFAGARREMWGDFPREPGG